MDKVKIDFQIPEAKEIDYRGQKIELVPFITVAQQIYLINKYVNEYFNIQGKRFIDKDKYNYLEAEFNLVSYLAQFLMNAEPKMPNEVYVDSEFLNIFVEHVENFDDFCSLLYDTVENIKEQIEIENSVGPILENISNKLYEVLESFSDLAPEEIEKLQDKGMDMLEKLNESSLIKESSQRKKG